MRLTSAEARRCMATAQCVEDSLRMALEIVGIELVDYGTVQFIPERGDTYIVQARSKAWRDKAERQTVAR